MLTIAVAALYPFWYVVVVFFSTLEGYFADYFHVLPRSFSFTSYLYALQHPLFLRAFLNSVIVTSAGTLLSLILSVMGGYVLSKKRLRGRRLLLGFIIVTMFFEGGLVPFVVVVRTLNLHGTLLAYFIPRAVNAFWMILMKNYFLSLSESLEDSARIDGAGNFRILFQIIVPVSKPLVVTIGLFYGVYFWNDFLLPWLFSGPQRTYTFALFLRYLIGSVSNEDLQVYKLQLRSPRWLKQHS